ncbi:MAG: hypothetical protein ACI9UR_002776 [Bacteroidia bacterium]|jgi:hypothetical protein
MDWGLAFKLDHETTLLLITSKLDGFYGLPLMVTFYNSIMKNLLIIALLAAVSVSTTFNQAFAKGKKIALTCSVQNAEIFSNGKLVGTGSATVVVNKNTQILVEFKKVGFLTIKKIFFYMKNQPKPPKTFHATMKPDDAYEASMQTDVANVNIELPTSRTKDEAWQVLNRVILSYMDVIETTDKETGYIRTAWTVQNFSQSTIRTRIIVRNGSADPLSYIFKLVCEVAAKTGVSPKDDQLFKEWDRVLRKYEPIASELPSRMK